MLLSFFHQARPLTVGADKDCHSRSNPSYIYIYRDYDDHDDHCHKGGTFGLLTSLSTQVFPLVCYIYRVLGETMIVVTEIMAEKEWNS